MHNILNSKAITSGYYFIEELYKHWLPSSLCHPHKSKLSVLPGQVYINAYMLIWFTH